MAVEPTSRLHEGHTTIAIPNILLEEANSLLKSSSFLSTSELVRNLLRDWIAKNKPVEQPKQDFSLTKSQVLSQGTILHLLPEWVENFKRNLPLIKKSKDILDLPKNPGSSIIIGAGPSLLKFKHLEMLAKSDYKGFKIASDRILIRCLENNVIPDMVISVDSDKSILDFYDSPLVDKHMEKIKALFNVTVQPKLTKKWKGEKFFFIGNLGSNLRDIQFDTGGARIMQLLSKKTIVETGGNVGSTAWFVSNTMGRRPVCLIGMDLGWSLDIKLEDTETFSTYMRIHNNDIDKVLKCYRRDHNSFFNNDSITDYVFDTYFEVFRSWIEAANVPTINCTGAGIIHSFKNLECKHFNDFLKEYKE